jgi:hypothetical protein
MTPVLYNTLAEKSLLVAVLARGLTSRCPKTDEERAARASIPITLPPTAKPQKFTGKSSVGDETFDHSGTLAVSNGTLILDVIFEPSAVRTQRAVVHVELSQDGGLEYSETLR